MPDGTPDDATAGPAWFHPNPTRDGPVRAEGPAPTVAPALRRTAPAAPPHTRPRELRARPAVPPRPRLRRGSGRPRGHLPRRGGPPRPDRTGARPGRAGQGG